MDIWYHLQCFCSVLRGEAYYYNDHSGKWRVVWYWFDNHNYQHQFYTRDHEYYTTVSGKFTKSQAWYTALLRFDKGLR